MVFTATGVFIYVEPEKRGFIPKYARLIFLGHFFLLHLFVYYVTGSKFFVNILEGDAHLDHENEGVVGKVCDLVDRFLFIVCLGGDDHLGAFLADLF